MPWLIPLVLMISPPPLDPSSLLKHSETTLPHTANTILLLITIPQCLMSPQPHMNLQLHTNNMNHQHITKSMSPRVIMRNMSLRFITSNMSLPPNMNLLRPIILLLSMNLPTIRQRHHTIHLTRR